MAQLFAQSLRFGLVGLFGLIVNIAVVYLTKPFFKLQICGALAFLVAATATWALHRNFTFRGINSDEPKRQWGLFIAANVLGGSIYYLTFWILVTRNHTCQVYPFVAVCIGGAAAMVVNFIVSRHLVFRARGI